MNLPLFLVVVFFISFSGAMQPGPVTAAAVALGAKSPWAGAMMAVGHAVIEVPLIILVIAGADTLLKSDPAQISIGLAGGVFLCFIARAAWKSSRRVDSQDSFYSRTGPLTAGIITTIGNPFFFIWWATVGLALVATAQSWGLWAVGIFAVVHWLCDLLWLQAVSWASFKGTKVFGPRFYKGVLKVCAIALLLFAGLFIYTSVLRLLGTGGLFGAAF